MSTGVLLLGSNINPRFEFLASARNLLGTECGRIIQCSSIYESEAWGFEADSFLNQVIVLDTILSPLDLLLKIQNIEKSLGRIRGNTDESTYNSRTIDIDILFYDELCLNHPQLQIPHPRIATRRFVLVPLCEILPEFRHPVLNKSISQMLATCDDPLKVTFISKQ